MRITRKTREKAQLARYMQITKQYENALQKRIKLVEQQKEKENEKFRSYRNSGRFGFGKGTKRDNMMRLLNQFKGRYNKLLRQVYVQHGEYDVDLTEVKIKLDYYSKMVRILERQREKLTSLEDLLQRRKEEVRSYKSNYNKQRQIAQTQQGVQKKIRPEKTKGTGYSDREVSAKYRNLKGEQKRRRNSPNSNYETGNFFDQLFGKRR